MKIDGLEIRDRDEYYINLNPLQTGGKSTPAAQKAVISYVDGYSVCDWCKGALHLMARPPIADFLREVSEFIGMDETLLTNGCRESKFAIMHAIAKPGDAIVLDGNAHYTSFVAAERAGLKIYKVENTEHPEFKILPEKYAEIIEKVKAETKKLPALTLLTHIDGHYGNLVDSKKVSKISHDYKIPFLLNVAYSSGRMPIDGKKLGADFLAASGHKSWAAGGGSIGLLAVTEEWKNKIFEMSKLYKVKPLEILGCSSRGASSLALMASFPYVKERVKKWDKEVENARWVMKELGKIGVNQLGETPHNHDLNFVESEILFKISQKHKKKRFFLYEELKSRGIVGIKAGLTKHFKMSTYGYSKEQIEHIAWAFKDIVEKFEKII